MYICIDALLLFTFFIGILVTWLIMYLYAANYVHGIFRFINVTVHVHHLFGKFGTILLLEPIYCYIKLILLITLSPMSTYHVVTYSVKLGEYVSY
jgi:hypothetical protein